jgi:PhzF family phenazine biosynthesis protein
MKLKLYQVDAFASRPFEGNPAAVCPLDEWPDDSLLQAVAEENNLSETAFFARSDRGFDLRWFTPVAEVDLCGHATLASAHVLFHHLNYPDPSVDFHTRSGRLTVTNKNGELQMDFPIVPSRPCKPPDILAKGLGVAPLHVLEGDDYLAVYPDESTVRSLSPDFSLLARLGLRGVIVTAPGDTADFVSRFFAPKLGIPEDPVTGSAHCQLTPYWAEKLGKSIFRARQVSRRGGELACELSGKRVLLTGKAVTVLEGVMSV